MQTSITLVVVLGLLYFLSKQAGKTLLVNSDGFVALRLNKFYQYFGWLMFLIGAGISLFTIGELNISLIIIILFMSILLIVMGSLFLMWYNNHRVVFNDQEISCVNWTGKMTNLNWQDVESVSFSAFSGYLKLKDGHGKVMKMHMHLVGLKTLTDLIEQKTGKTAAQLKIPLNGMF